MPRIRTTKPGFTQSEQVMDCEIATRYLFQNLWNYCDDAGRHALKPRTIKAEIFPGDDINSENILGMLQELSKNGLIIVYETDDGERYLQVTGWKHQRIDKPQKSHIPGPDSATILRTFCEYSKNDLGTFVTDSKGRERKEGKEDISNKQQGVVSPSAHAREAQPPSNAAADSGLDAANQIIAIFDQEIVRTFGEAQARPWPHQRDRSVASRLVDAGAERHLDRIRGVIREKLCRMRDAGQSPPKVLGYVENPIREAITDAMLTDPIVDIQRMAETRRLRSEQIRREEFERLRQIPAGARIGDVGKRFEVLEREFGHEYQDVKQG